jgi:hypothetical protein
MIGVASNAPRLANFGVLFEAAEQFECAVHAASPPSSFRIDWTNSRITAHLSRHSSAVLAGIASKLLRSGLWSGEDSLKISISSAYSGAGCGAVSAR